MKKGITMSVVLIAIVIMLILITSATVVGTNAMNTAKYEDFKSSVGRVSNNVNVYYLQNKELPVKNEIVATNSLNQSFKSELEKKGDLNQKLFVVDMAKVGDATIQIGRGNTNSEDIFLIAEDSQNVYYLKGFEYKKVRYYGV